MHKFWETADGRIKIKTSHPRYLREPLLVLAEANRLLVGARF